MLPFPLHSLRSHQIPAVHVLSLFLSPTYLAFHPSARPSVLLQVVGTLCMQLLLQFYSDFSETLQGLRMVRRCAYCLDIILRLCFVTFSQN